MADRQPMGPGTLRPGAAAEGFDPGAALKRRIAAPRRVLAALLGWGLLALVSVWASAPPTAAPLDAPPTVPSGERAMDILAGLARSGRDAGQPSAPRPIGSAAGDRCRDRILGELRALGLRPEVQETLGVFADQECAGVVRNVVCRLRGQGTSAARGGGRVSQERQAILCMAHYDSVGAGPGIADDLAGVAALLEVARALQSSSPLERDVIFLFEDGEEHGLLGAEVFAAKHPWAREVGAVVNLEGRGTTGPSRLFEMGAGNEWIVRAFKAQSTRPSTTSVSAEIYKRMPNDTDYTVWRERGIPGLNFACIGGVNRYHTPLDDLANLSVDTLQHHATNALESIRALDGAADWPIAAAAGSASSRDAVFFSLLGRYVVLYQTRTARILGVLLAIGALIAAARGIRSGMARPLWIVGAGGLAFAVLGLGFLAARTQGSYLELLGVDSAVGHPTHMAPVMAGYLAAAFAGVGLGAYLIGYLCRAAEVGLATTLLLALLSAISAWAAPGLSFLFAIPAVMLCLGGLVLRQRGDVGARWARLSAVTLLVSAFIMLTPLHSGLMDAFGVADPGVAVGPVLLGALLLLPAFMGEGRASGLWLAGLGAIAALLSGVFVSQLPTHSAALPGHVNLVHIQTEDGARWQIMGGADPVDRGLLSDLQEALGGGLDSAGKPVQLRNEPWSWRVLAGAPAPASADDLPSLEVQSEVELEDGATLRSVKVSPGRRSDQLLVRLQGAGSLLIEGVLMPGRDLRLLGVGEASVEFQIRDEMRSDGLSVELASKQFGLRGVRGRAAEKYLASRPEEFVPFSDGDGSLMKAVVELREPKAPPEAPPEAQPKAESKSGPQTEPVSKDD